MDKSDFAAATRRFCDELAAIECDARAGTAMPGLVTRLREAIDVSSHACREAERGVREEAQFATLRAAFQAQIARWFSRSWFMRRALEKPRGYPGDFETLEGIYAGELRSEDGFGRALDAYFLETELACAVRERKNACATMLGDFLERQDGERADVLDIACGPCRELHEVPRLASDIRFRFTGIDQDQAAIDHAAAGVARAGLPQDRIGFRRENALRLTSPQRNLDRLGQFDLIYSAGLYDYLPDRHLIPLIAGTGALLRSECSEYVVAFKDAERYDRTVYQWHVDWIFFQRTEDDCRRLLESTGLDIASMRRDASGTILFFTLRRR